MAVANRTHSVWDDVNFYESEGDCTSEMGAGQFSIFGAVEENGGRGSLREERDEVKGEARTIRPLDGGGCRARRVAAKEWGAVGGRNIHRGRTGNAERQLLALRRNALTTEDSEVRGQDALATAGGTPALRSRDEPGQQAVLKFLRGCAEGAAVVGVGDFPQVCVWGACVNSLRVTYGDVAVDFAVNQENRDCCSCGGILWGNLLHVQVVLPTRAEEGDFYERAEECASDPGAQTEGLSHAVVGDLAKSGEGGFGDDGADVRMCIERLEELGGAHGFAEGEDAAGMILGF
jgi:hypothetical protein